MTRALDEVFSEEPLRLGKGVAVVRAAAGREAVYRALEVGDRGLQRGHDRRRGLETDYAYAAARAYLARAGAAGGFGNDVYKRLRPEFHVRERRAAHAAGAVEREHDVRRVGHDIRRRGQGEGHLELVAAAYRRGVSNFVGIGHTHLVLPPSGDGPRKYIMPHPCRFVTAWLNSPAPARGAAPRENEPPDGT